MPGRKGDTIVDTDEGPREGTTAEGLSKLRGLVKDGTHTAGNSPSVNDGGAALVLASEEWAQKNGKQILGEIVGHAQVADDFRTSPRPQPQPPRRRSTVLASPSTTSTCGSSTRRSRPSA